MTDWLCSVKFEHHDGLIWLPALGSNSHAFRRQFALHHKLFFKMCTVHHASQVDYAPDRVMEERE